MEMLGTTEVIKVYSLILSAMIVCVCEPYAPMSIRVGNEVKDIKRYHTLHYDGFSIDIRGRSSGVGNEFSIWISPDDSLTVYTDSLKISCQGKIMDYVIMEFPEGEIARYYTFNIKNRKEFRYKFQGSQSINQEYIISAKNYIKRNGHHYDLDSMIFVVK